MNEQDVITVSELKYLMDNGRPVNLIDVREPNEYGLCHVDGSKLFPLGDLTSRIVELDVNAEYIVYCHTGQRIQEVWIQES